MKNSILLLFALGLSFSLFGQSNRNGISYQALITSPVNEKGITISLPGVDKKSFHTVIEMFVCVFLF